MAESKVEQLAREFREHQEALDKDETGLDRMMFLMACKENGIHPTRGFRVVEGERVAAWSYLPDVPVYPERSADKRAQEDEWERRSEAMHADQCSPILPEARPTTNALRDKRRITRGD